MSIESAKKFEEIVMYLSVLRYIFKSRSKRGLTDLNKNAEPFFKCLLNLIFKWDLIDLNELKTNFPAIDLGDISTGICVQVTAENGSSKIKDTIEKFNKYMLHENYNRLVFYILTEKKAYSTEFDTDNKFKFDKKADIWDVDDVLEVIEKLDVDRMGEIHSFLKKELSSIVNMFVDKGSLLSQIEEIVGVEPVDSLAYLDHLGYPDEHIEEGKADVLKLFKKLTVLSRASREFLFLLLNRAKMSSPTDHNACYAFSGDVESYANLTRAQVQEQLSILDSNNLAHYESEDYPPRIEIYYMLECGENIFVMLKEYLNNDDLENLIVNCDFSMLDG